MCTIRKYIWYCPINYKRAKEAGYNLHNYIRPNDRNQNRNDFYYNNKLPINCQISQDEDDYNHYCQMDKSDAVVYWIPTEEVWNKWKSYAPVLTIRWQNMIIGQISYIHRNGLIAATKSKVNIAEISWVHSLDFEDNSKDFRS